MKKYCVISDPVTITAGKLQLTDNQSRPRVHRLRNICDDVFEVIHPVKFKAGEVFGFDGSMNRYLEDGLKLVDEDKPKRGRKQQDDTDKSENQD